MCQKKSFTKVEALTILNKNKKHRKGEKYRKECRAYQCSVCNMWHLTSFLFYPPAKQSKSIKIIEADRWSKLLGGGSPTL